SGGAAGTCGGLGEPDLSTARSEARGYIRADATSARSGMLKVQMCGTTVVSDAASGAEGGGDFYSANINIPSSDFKFRIDLGGGVPVPFEEVWQGDFTPPVSGFAIEPDSDDPTPGAITQGPDGRNYLAEGAYRLAPGIN